MRNFRRCACGDLAQAGGGRPAGARALFNRLLPPINYERLYGVAIYKEVLYRRGVFATTVARAPGQQLDDDRAELDAILENVGMLFSV